MKSAKPNLSCKEGYWEITNFTECLRTTTLNSKERWWVHQALVWVKRMSNYAN